MTTVTSPQSHHATRDRRRRKVSAQYLAWFIHSFIGLKLTLIMSVILLSGALSVMSEEIDWLIYPEMRVEQQPGQVHLDPGEITDRIKPDYPDLGLYYIETYPDRPYLAAQADFDRPDGSWAKLWINPYTGEVNGELDYLTPGRFLAQLHGSLFLNGPGRMVVNAFGVLVLVSLITGLIAYPKFWRYFFRKPRTGNLRVFLGDLHKLVGLWSLWIVVLMAISGSWWFYKNPLVSEFSAPDPVSPRLSKPLLDYKDMDTLGDHPRFLPAAEIVQAAKEAYPALEISILRPPEHNADSYTVLGLADEWLVTPWRGNSIYLNPYTAEVTGADLTEQVTFGQRFDMAMGSLHYGNWGYGSAHVPVKLAWFFGGLAMTFLSISGMLINYKRARKASKKLKQYHWLAQRIPLLQSERSQHIWRIVRPWGGPMSGFKYVNVGVLVLMVIGLVGFISTQLEGVSDGHLYQQQALGPWQVSARARPNLPGQAPVKAGANVNLNVYIPIPALEKIKFIYARVGKPRTLRAPGSIIHGPIGAKHVHLPVPARANQKSELWITAQTWDGQVYQASWPLFPVE